MSKWTLVFLCCFAANAFASSADSGRCPWKIPFTVTINGIGGQHSYQYSTDPRSYPDTDYGTHSSTDGFQITVDTGSAFSISQGAKYSLTNDMLGFSWVHKDTLGFVPYPGFTSLGITFAHGKDSIISISIEEIDSFSNTFSNSFFQHNFQISSLSFDDTSIFSSDSTFSDHRVSMSDFGKQTNYLGNNEFVYIFNDFNASSVTLSGIFRPMHYADQPPAIVVQAATPSGSLSVTSLNGSLHCSFGTSAEERLLEIFTPLGIKAASCAVPPGGTQAVVPHISPGFYFVRLGSAVAKVYVME